MNSENMTSEPTGTHNFHEIIFKLAESFHKHALKKQKNLEEFSVNNCHDFESNCQSSY
jgi:hypothetical protein